ncbi:MAG: 6,7-dimethyl-8-ribityllumazine synthase [Flavobacteriales bacterium]|nr:6,7-dimethyl-8-ribityllumazine synthase [Flavobacteriales bacterium]
MATENKNLSEFEELPKVDPTWRIAIVKAEWNAEITDGLYDGAMDLLINAHIVGNNIETMTVPGSFELPLGAQWAIEKLDVDAVICLGSVVRGETAHFDYVCQSVSLGIKDVAIETGVPVIFGVLTDDNMDQARARSGGKHGNKGVEAAVTALKMLHLRDSLEKRSR